MTDLRMLHFYSPTLATWKHVYCLLLSRLGNSQGWGGVGWALLSGPDGPVSPAPDLGAGMNDSLRVLYGRRMEGAAVWGSLIVLWSEMQKVTGLLFHFPPKGGSLMAKPDLVSWLKGTEDPFMWGSEDSERPAGSCCFHMCVVGGGGLDFRAL